ncbi:hypothetical protein H257_04208 [Aphanomyces astaci]|uniref:HAT C-terminal dimerisation domain-containing protein n=1 Tax=Aphanomyces astaci TaxID=112090 RepID=W4GUX5_APHAT|nr:hypothetical protein H257_04208 [Aphanomyces astaci]ETV83487.1 hypothetical protein H257_04208 [Aphanomyces astaci]|eukprot:XP_009826917.1 hypothetical protein H257_04208 [Aphanomyces astaci]
MKYMHALCAHVERKIASQLPDQFALVHDGWSHGSTHYLAIFATFPSSDPIGYTRTHRFNLFMSDVLADHADVIDKVNQLMTKLRFTLPAARLRRLTPLVAKTNNNREVTALLTKLEDLNAITLALQSEDCSLLDARQIFDTVIEDYPDAAARLGRSAAIVKNPAFEDGVVKVLLESEASLTNVEAEAIKALRDSQASQGSEEGVAVPALSLAERALKKKKVMRAPSVYKDCRFLRPTSNMCERFFSATKLAVGDRRCSITPKNFEE